MEASCEKKKIHLGVCFPSSFCETIFTDFLGQRRERLLVVDVEIWAVVVATSSGTAVAAARSTATPTSVTTSVTASVTATTSTTSTATTTVWTLESGIDFQEDFLCLLRTGLWSILGLMKPFNEERNVRSKITDLSGKVGVFLFILLERDCVFPDFTAVDFPGLQLGDVGKLLVFLLSQVLVEGQCVVLLFGLSFTSTAAFAFGGSTFCCGCVGSSGWGTPSIVSGSSTAPSVVFDSGCALFDSSVFGCGLFCLEFGDTVIASPRLVNLLLRIADWRSATKDRTKPLVHTFCLLRCGDQGDDHGLHGLHDLHVRAHDHGHEPRCRLENISLDGNTEDSKD